MQLDTVVTSASGGAMPILGNIYSVGVIFDILKGCEKSASNCSICSLISKSLEGPISNEKEIPH